MILTAEIEQLEKMLRILMQIEAPTERESKLLNQAYAGVKSAIEAIDQLNDQLND